MKPESSESNKPTEAVEDAVEAERRAYAVQLDVGEEIDDEFEKLKIAQAFGLKDRIEESKKNIQNLVGKAEKGIEENKWVPALESIFKYASLLDNGHSYPIDDKIAALVEMGSLKKLKSYLQHKFPTVAGRPERGGADKRYTLIEGTNLVFVEDTSGGTFVLSKGSDVNVAKTLLEMEKEEKKGISK